MNSESFHAAEDLHSQMSQFLRMLLEETNIDLEPG